MGRLCQFCELDLCSSSMRHLFYLPIRHIILVKSPHLLLSCLDPIKKFTRCFDNYIIDLSDTSVSVGFRFQGLGFSVLLRAMRSVYNSKFNLVGLIILCKSGLVPRRKEISIRKPLKFIKYLLHLHDGPKWNPNQSEGPINF